MSKDPETLEGYVVDIACLRRWRQNEVPDRARAHTRACALEGHCLESGFGLVDDQGRTALLGPDATLGIIEAVKESPHERGIRLCVVRGAEDGKLKTLSIAEI